MFKMQFESSDLKMTTVLEQIGKSPLYTIDQIESFINNQSHDGLSLIFQSCFEPPKCQKYLEIIFNDILSKSNRVSFFEQKFDTLFFTDSERENHLDLSMISNLTLMTRQYRGIYCGFERIKKFLSGDSNLEEVEATGAGYSRWWLFRSDSGTKWMISCHISTFDEITSPKRTGYEKVEFRELTSTQIKEIFRLDVEEENLDLSPSIKITSDFIETLKKID